METQTKNGGKITFEILRLITPALITLGIFLMTQINSKLDCLDARIFIHLSNDELHTPRSIVCTKNEFSLYCKMRDEQWARMYESLDTINRQNSELAAIMNTVNKKLR